MYSNAVFLQHCERAIAGLHPGGSNKGEAESAVITARMVSEDMLLKTENSAEWDVKFNTVNQVSMMSVFLTLHTCMRRLTQVGPNSFRCFSFKQPSYTVMFQIMHTHIHN